MFGRRWFVLEVGGVSRPTDWVESGELNGVSVTEEISSEVKFSVEQESMDDNM